MSLQGSLDTFQLPDVLVLLANTKKSGELRVVGGRVDGRVWLDDGRLVQTEVGASTEPVDAVWELLRLKEGTFSFEQEASAPAPRQPQLVDLVLADAQARLLEWTEIERVVPSLDARVALAPEAPGDEVIISADQWRVFVAVGDGRTVHALMDKLAMGEFETCRWLRDLAEGGMVTIDASAPAVAAHEPAPATKPAADDALLRPAKKGRRSQEQEAVAEAPAEVEVVEEPAVEASEAGLGEGFAEEAPAEVHAGPSEAEASELVAQLAALNGGDEESLAAVAAAVAEGGEVPVVGEDGEPLNRGLLLKFLSSVRS